MYKLIHLKKISKKTYQKLIISYFFSFFLFFPLFEQYSNPFLAKPALAWPPIKVRDKNLKLLEGGNATRVRHSSILGF